MGQALLKLIVASYQLSLAGSYLSSPPKMEEREKKKGKGQRKREMERGSGRGEHVILLHCGASDQ